MRMVRRSTIVLGLGMVLGAPAMADQGGVDVSGGVTLASDYLFRGVSQTLGDPAVQVSLDAELESGLYGFLWASNVDFVPDDEPDDGARYEINAALGFATDLSEHWSIDALLARYVFPGTVDAVDYDYNELLLTLGFAERVSATVGYSDEVFGEDAAGWFYGLSGDLDLPADFSLSARAGYYDLDAAYGASYAYSVIAVSRPVGEVDLTLAWYDTHGDAEELFYRQAIGSRVVLSLDFAFLH